jgi:3-oxoacyl-[acyl-carrier protein] reductase
VLICSRAVFPHMQAQGGGSIINISSTAAYPLPLPAFPSESFGNYAYAISKAGVIALTQQMARQGGTAGIRVNAIAPGVTMSEATKKVVPQWALEGLEKGAALGSVLQPDDLAGTAVHLASEDSRMMTGQVLVVDAGVVMHG